MESAVLRWRSQNPLTVARLILRLTTSHSKAARITSMTSRSLQPTRIYPARSVIMFTPHGTPRVAAQSAAESPLRPLLTAGSPSLSPPLVNPTGAGRGVTAVIPESGGACGGEEE